MNYIRRIFFVLLLSCMGGLSHAAIISYSTIFTISTSNFTYISVGDQFQFLFSIDDSVLDTNNFESDLVGIIQRSGQFPNALTSASLTALADNVGSFDPSGTGFSPNIVTSDQISGGIIGSPVVDTISFSFGVALAGGGDITISELLLNDMGVGQSFAEVSGGRLDRPTVSANIDFLSLTEASGLERATGSASSLTVVPIPAAFWLFSSAFGLLLFSIRKQRKER